MISNLNGKSTLRCLKYISKDDQLKLKDEFGNELKSKEVFYDWKLKLNTDSKDCWHLIFSIQEDKNLENFQKLEEAVIETMKINFLNHDFVLVKHDHQNNPHIHLVLNKKNRITKKRLHFKTKNEISDLFKKVREDFSIALNYRSLEYQTSQKIERLNELVQQYEVSKTETKLNDKEVVNKTTNILLKQMKILENIRQSRQKSIENKYLLCKELKNKMRKNKTRKYPYFKDLREFQSINQTIKQDYQFLAKISAKENKIKKEYLNFEKNIKIQMGSNFNVLKTINFLEKRIGKKYIGKKDYLNLMELKNYYVSEENEFKNFYSNSPLTEIFRKTLNIRELVNIYETQKSFMSKDVENMVVYEINERVKKYKKSIIKAKPKTKDFLEKELRLADKFMLSLNKEKTLDKDIKIIR